MTTVSPASGDLGGNVTLICNVTSLYSPVTSVTWEFDGTRIDPQSDDRFRGGSVTAPSLFINNLKTTDQGNYSCSASNMFGSGQANIYLIIKSKYTTLNFRHDFVSFVDIWFWGK